MKARVQSYRSAVPRSSTADGGIVLREVRAIRAISSACLWPSAVIVSTTAFVAFDS
jgi:hypothetical protein